MYMNYTLRTIVSTVLILFILIFGYYFLFARQQGQYIPQGWEDFDCMYPISIASDALQPTLKRGSMLILNSCVSENTPLDVDNVVIFNINGIDRVGIIKDTLYEGKNKQYRVSTDSIETQEYIINIDEVIAYTVIPNN